MSARASFAIVAMLAAASLGCGTRIDSQRLPIGGPCNSSGQCGTGKFFCDTSHANGYCKADCGKDADCPGGSVCVGAGLIVSGACAQTCASASDCRAGDLCMSGDASATFCDKPPVLDLSGSD
jgi:hypothetical protein